MINFTLQILNSQRRRLLVCIGQEAGGGCRTGPEILILGVRRDVYQICAVLGYYAASCGNCLPTFRDDISVPRVGLLKMGLICCPETSVNDYYTKPCNIQEERKSWSRNSGEEKDSCPLQK
jgi:hypothetical protein